jgi:hypothetical protein
VSGIRGGSLWLVLVSAILVLDRKLEARATDFTNPIPLGRSSFIDQRWSPINGAILVEMSLIAEWIVLPDDLLCTSSPFSQWEAFHFDQNIINPFISSDCGVNNMIRV